MTTQWPGEENGEGEGGGGGGEEERVR
jgi:hypothetical protein